MATADDRNNQCSVCGCYSTAHTCWPCSQIVTGKHPALAELNKTLIEQRTEIERLQAELTACEEFRDELGVANNELIMRAIKAKGLMDQAIWKWLVPD